MTVSDYIGFSAGIGFGLWWLVFPKSVTSFYSWFHRGRVKMPGTLAIRLAGALWIVLVTVVVFLTFRKH